MEVLYPTLSNYHFLCMAEIMPLSRSDGDSIVTHNTL